MPSGALGLCFCGIKQQSRVLNTFPGASSKHQVRVQGRAPTRKEAALDLRVLSESGFTNTLASQSILLKSRCKWILSGTRMLLLKELTAGQTRTSDGMVEGLWLRLCRRRSCESGLSFSWRGCGGEEMDFLADGTAQVTEGLRLNQLDCNGCRMCSLTSLILFG